MNMSGGQTFGESTEKIVKSFWKTGDQMNKHIKHGHALRGKQTKTYMCWQDMKKRCSEFSIKNKKYYFDKGITVCDAWVNDFQEFLKDMGEKPDGLSIDRIDGTKGYSKDNCRWATSKEQNNNRCNNVILEWNEHFYTITQLEDFLKLNRGTIKMWIYRGKDIKLSYEKSRSRRKRIKVSKTKT